jgi:hypothetical protein
MPEFILCNPGKHVAVTGITRHFRDPGIDMVFGDLAFLQGKEC